MRGIDERLGRQGPPVTGWKSLVDRGTGTGPMCPREAYPPPHTHTPNCTLQEGSADLPPYIITERGDFSLAELLDRGKPTVEQQRSILFDVSGLGSFRGYERTLLQGAAQQHPAWCQCWLAERGGHVCTPAGALAL